MIRALLPLLFEIASAESAGCSCDRVNALEAEVLALKSSIESLVRHAVAEEIVNVEEAA